MVIFPHASSLKILLKHLHYTSPMLSVTEMEVHVLSFVALPFVFIDHFLLCIQYSCFFLFGYFFLISGRTLECPTIRIFWPSILVNYRLSNDFKRVKIPLGCEWMPDWCSYSAISLLSMLHETLTSAVPGFCDQEPAGGFQSGLILAILEAGFLVK